MKKYLRALIVLVATTAAVGVRANRQASAQPDATGILAVTGATLLDIITGQQIDNSIVLIEGDRIRQVGRAASLRVPDTARIIDARGGWIIPGLIDSHAHAGDDPNIPLSLFLANGVTTIRNPGGQLTPLRLTRAALESGKLVGPRLFLAGPVLDGLPPVFPTMSLMVDTPQRAESTARFLIDQGVDFLKVYNNITEPALVAIVRVARE